jgi:hypothetical protein
LGLLGMALSLSFHFWALRSIFERESDTGMWVEFLMCTFLAQIAQK